MTLTLLAQESPTKSTKISDRGSNFVYKNKKCKKRVKNVKNQIKTIKTLNLEDLDHLDLEDDSTPSTPSTTSSAPMRSTWKIPSTAEKSTLINKQEATRP